MVKLQHPTLGTFEGTPSEIAESLARLRDHGLLDTPTVTIIPRPEGTAQARLAEVPTNERTLYDYENAPGMQRKTKRAYAASVREFERQIAPKNFLDATEEDARRFERACLDTCAHLKSTVFAEGKAGGSTRFACKAGVFSWVGAPPRDMCNRDCSLWKKQETGPMARLKALKHFYGWLKSTRLVRANIFDEVSKSRGRVKRNVVVKKKYAPTTAEVRELLSEARRSESPLEAALLMALAKWGRRPAHTVDLHAADLVGIITPDPDLLPFADFTSVKERFESRPGDGATKLLGFLTSPIDAEFLAFLREEFLPWRQERWCFAWNEGPLFPGHRKGEPVSEEQVQEILDRLMRKLSARGSAADRERWRSHLEDKRRRVTSGSFRHYASTTWRQMGLQEMDRDILRGDVPKATRATYEHIDERAICAIYKFPELLS